MRTVDALARTSEFFDASLRRAVAWHEKTKGDPGDVLREAYVPRVMDTARRTWTGRMINEHRSSAVFAGLLPQLIEASCGIDAQMAVLSMAQDELHHALLCGRVVRAFGAESRASAEPVLKTVPAHSRVDPIERVLRNAMSIGKSCRSLIGAFVNANPASVASNC